MQAAQAGTRRPPSSVADGGRECKGELAGPPGAGPPRGPGCLNSGRGGDDTREGVNACPGSVDRMDSTANLPASPEGPAPLGELVLQNGRLSGARRPLAGPLTLIGQVAGCDVRLAVEGVN